MVDQEQFWFDHLRAIDISGSTTKAYGELHGLSVAKLYEWRKRFRTRSEKVGSVALVRPSVGNPFVAVTVNPSVATEPAHCVVQCGAVRLEFDTLPSVQWIASLNQAIRRAS